MLELVAKPQQICVLHISSQANEFTGLEQIQDIQSDTSDPAVNVAAHVAAHVEAHDAARQLLDLPNCSDHKSSSQMQYNTACWTCCKRAQGCPSKMSLPGRKCLSK